MNIKLQTHWVGQLDINARRLLTEILTSVDQLRVGALRIILKVSIIRKVYQNCTLRLGVAFFVLSVINLSLAFFRPDILLVFGPMFYGYAHLIASYRFTTPLPHQNMSFKKTNKKFLIFAYGTFFILIYHLLLKSFSDFIKFPHNSWEILVSLVVFLYLALSMADVNKKLISVIAILGAVVLRLVWLEPLVFVSVTLFIHNWVAFAYWIYVAKDKSNRIGAIFATLVFAAIHFLVFSGLTDSLINIQNGGAILAANVEATAWILAPWSDDPIVWQRALILYTFGLALHYFVWLKAIPENIQVSNYPSSFKVTIEKMKREFGGRMLTLILVISFIGTFVWLFSFSLGAHIYFGFSSLHTWLELIFFIVLIFNSFHLKAPKISDIEVKKNRRYPL